MLTMRPYQADDRAALYNVCLCTGGPAGTDGTHIYHDPDLLGHFYVGPYIASEPELSFVLVNSHHVVCGYILGTSNSHRFSQWCEQVWFPPLRKRYPLPTADDTSPDAQVIRLIHQGYHPDPALDAFPAHLHIDLLPESQGQGRGRALMTAFLDNLHERGVPAVHLVAAQNNLRALRFYRKLGFEDLLTYPGATAFGMHLHEEELHCG